MKYNWTTADFLKQIDLLRVLIQKERNPERKYYLEKVLDSSQYIFHQKFSQFKEPTESIKQRLCNINDERLSYGRYYSIIQDFYFSLEPLEDKIAEVEVMIESSFGDDFDISNITGAYVTNDKAISLTKVFYTNLDQDLLPYFNEAFNDRFTTLRFNGHVGPYTLKSTDGNTTFIDGVRKNFINICKTRSASKIFTLIHEYGHATKNLYYPEKAYSNDDGLFEEVDGIFPELIALEENVGNLPPLFIAFQKYTTLITYYNNADALVLHNIILNSWKDHNYRTNNSFTKYLKREYDIEEEVLQTALETTLFDEGTYVISYLVAMELLHIYKKDKKQALTLYKEFLNIPADKDIFPFVTKLIAINKNILSEATSVVDEMKLQLESWNRKHV